MSRNVGTQIAFPKDRSSKLTIWLSIHAATREPSPYLSLYPISIWYCTGDASCKGKSLRVQQMLHPESALNRLPCQAKEPVWMYVTVVSQNPASFEYFLVEMSLPAFPIVLGRSQELKYSLQLLSGMVWQQSCLFGAWRPPECSIRQFHTWYLSHESNWLHPPIPVGSIRQISSADAEHSPCGAVPFYWLCPSPSQVHHHHWTSRALYLLHHLSLLLHPAHHRNLQHRSDCLRSYKIICSNIVSGFPVIAPSFAAVVISCIITVSVSWTRFRATAVSLSTQSSIHFSLSSLLKKFISCLFSTASFVLDRKLRNPPNARILSATMPLLPSFVS